MNYCDVDLKGVVSVFPDKAYKLDPPQLPPPDDRISLAWKVQNLSYLFSVILNILLYIIIE